MFCVRVIGGGGGVYGGVGEGRGLFWTRRVVW